MLENGTRRGLPRRKRIFMIPSPGFALIARRVMKIQWILAMIIAVFNAINASVADLSQQTTGVTGGGSVTTVFTEVTRGSTPTRKIGQ